MIVGICGGSGSGKTTLLNQLSTYFSAIRPTVFSMDNYYLPIEKQVKDENGEYIFDLPSALDIDHLLSDLKTLMNGTSIQVKEYLFNVPSAEQRYIELQPSELIIVEGLFLFYFEELVQLLDYNVFIDIDSELQLERRLKRDVQYRGYTEAAVLYQWKQHVLPNFKKYVHPYEHLANFRFRNNEHAREDFETLVQNISKQLSKE